MSVVLKIEASEPRFVTVNGHPYRLRGRDDLSLREALQFDRLIKGCQPAVVKWQAGDELADDELEQLDEAFRVLARFALDAPAEVIDRLTPYQQMLVVVTAFFGGAAEPPQPAAPAPTKSRKRVRHG